MSYKQFRILIVDDDTALLKVLTVGFEKAGFTVVACSTADEAMNKARHSDFNLIVMDCMLPKTSGVDLALKIKKLHPQLPIVFISGIYKDRSFIQETLESCESQHFLVKPFNFENLQKIAESYAKSSPAFRPESWLDFWQEQNSKDIFQKRLAALKSINGQEVPFLISLILKYELDGSFKIKIPEVEAEIFFKNGVITRLQSSDKTSFFGALLIQSGLITEAEIEEHLKQHRNEPLGESLVKAQLLSPHAIEQTLKEQTLLRLSRSISALPSTVQWTPSPPLNTPPAQQQAEVKGVTSKDLLSYFLDWSHTKIKIFWLRNQYVSWLDDCPLLLVKSSENLSAELQEIKSLCNGQSSLNEVLQKAKDADKMLGTIHGLVLAQKIKWGRRKTQSPEIERLRQKLENLEKNFKESDHFTVLGVGQNAKEREIRKAYLDLSKSLHPDHLPADAPDDLKTLNSRVFTHVTKAHETLGNIGARETYLKSLQFESLKKQEEGQRSLYNALDLMDRKQYKQAYDIFVQIRNIASSTQYIDLYCLWADIKRRDRLGAEDARTIEQKLMALPPEDRHSYLFYFVKGILAVGRKLPEEAKSAFQNSLVLNPQFKQAAFELQPLLGNKGSLLNNLFNSSSSKKPA